MNSRRIFKVHLLFCRQARRGLRLRQAVLSWSAARVNNFQEMLSQFCL